MALLSSWQLNVARDYVAFPLRKSVFGEKFANQLPFLFVPNASEQLCSEPENRGGLIERHPVVNFSSLKMTGLATRLEDGLNLLLEIVFSSRWTGDRLADGHAAPV